MIAKYRTGSLKDLDGINAVEVACFEPLLRFPRSLLQRMMRDRITLIAEVEGQIAGLVMASIHKEKSQIVGYIDTLEVLPQCRGCRIGHTLLAIAEDELRAKHASYVALHVAITNGAAIALYKKQGYEIVSTAEHFYADKTAAHLAVHLL